MNKKIPILGLMALLAAGAVTTGTLALVNHGAQKDIDGSLDQAIYLYWGSGSSSASVTNVEDLVSGVKQYRALAVSPRATHTVHGDVRVTFKLTFDAAYSATGLTVGVYEAESLANAENGVYDAIGGKMIEFDCDSIVYSKTEEVNQSKHFDIEIEAGETVTKYYSIVFDYGGDDQGEGYEFGGLVTVSQAFIE